MGRAESPTGLLCLASQRLRAYQAWLGSEMTAGIPVEFVAILCSLLAAQVLPGRSMQLRDPCRGYDLQQVNPSIELARRHVWQFLAPLWPGDAAPDWLSRSDLFCVVLPLCPARGWC